jgi:hypothetical protein
MAASAVEVLREYLAAQAGGVEAALRLVSDEAVFDVGRGRYVGAAGRGYLERLRADPSESRLDEAAEPAPGRATAVFEQRDDDLAPLGIDAIRLDVEVELDDDGRIRLFRARPTPESIAALTAARHAGARSEGLRLAEQAGTLPPSDPA